MKSKSITLSETLFMVATLKRRLRLVEIVTAQEKLRTGKMKKNMTIRLALIEDPVPGGWHRVLLGGWYAEMGRCLWVKDD